MHKSLCTHTIVHAQWSPSPNAGRNFGGLRRRCHKPSQAILVHPTSIKIMPRVLTTLALL